MTTEIRVLDDTDDLVGAANLFRAAMVGFPPLSNLGPCGPSELAFNECSDGAGFFF